MFEPLAGFSQICCCSRFGHTCQIGCYFLQQHQLSMDFSTSPVTVSFLPSQLSPPTETFTTSSPEMQHIVQAERQRQEKICSVIAVTDLAIEVVKDTVISLFVDPVVLNILETFPWPLISTNIYLEVFQATFCPWDFTNLSRCHLDSLEHLDNMWSSLHHCLH